MRLGHQRFFGTLGQHAGGGGRGRGQGKGGGKERSQNDRARGINYQSFVLG